MAAANDTTIEGMMGGFPGVRQFGLNTNQPVDFSGAPSVALPGGTTIAGANNITSTSANAFTVGPNGTTNPMLQVDASAGSAATGLAILGKAAGSGIVLAAISSGTNEDLAFNTKATGKFRFSPGSNSTTAFQITKADGTTEIFKVDSTNASLIETSTNAAAFVVGPNGGTNPTFTIDASTASAATGLQIKSAAAASGLALSVISSGTDEKLTVDAKGAGDITIGKTSTGYTVIGKFMNLGALTNIATQNGTPTVAQLVGGYINHNSVTGAGTLTLPAGATLDAASFNLGTGTSFSCWYYNSGSQTVTITGASGTTVQGGTAAVTTGKSALLFFVRVTTSTWLCFPTTLF